MSSYRERMSKVISEIRPYIIASKSENDMRIRNDIYATTYKDFDVSVLQICRHQVIRKDITSEMRKYLLGKIYRATLNLNKNRHPDYKFFMWQDKPDSYKTCQEIADNLGREFNISGASIAKYDLYARSIDILHKSNVIPAVNILSEIENIPVENTIKLSKMSDDDVRYLKMLFDKQFYKMAGYVCIKSIDYSNLEITAQAPAMIKHMPPHDPDSMINSLSYTIPSWIKSIQTAIDKSDLSKISITASNNLEHKLQELKNTVDNILKRLEESKNE